MAMVEYNELLAEQKKTNELLTQLLQEHHRKNRQEARQFWLGLIWHSLPIILTAIFVWQLYNYVQAQITLFQDKFSQVETNIGTFNITDKLKGLLN